MNTSDMTRLIAQGALIYSSYTGETLKSLNGEKNNADIVGPAWEKWCETFPALVNEALAAHNYIFNMADDITHKV